MFEKLILNPYVKNALKQYMDKGQKNAQHLILSGPQGTGKRTCADILAHFLLDIRLDKPLHSCAPKRIYFLFQYCAPRCFD